MNYLAFARLPDDGVGRLLPKADFEGLLLDEPTGQLLPGDLLAIDLSTQMFSTEGGAQLYPSPETGMQTKC